MKEEFEVQPTHKTPEEETFKTITENRATMERNKRIISDLREDLAQSQKLVAELEQLFATNSDNEDVKTRLNQAKIHLAETQEVLFKDDQVIETIQTMGLHTATLNAQERVFRSKLN